MAALPARAPGPAVDPTTGPAPFAAGPAGPVPQSPLSLPPVSLPVGGGAIRGIGESFSASPATGTGSMAVPVATTPGRSGFGPQLALSYDSGRGNGPFGFGWSLSLPAVTRKTDRGLPRYQDSDVFLLSGAEDLVPVPGGGVRDGHRVQRFRPRVEGAFARVERWTRLVDGDVHWRSVSQDGVTTWFGEDGGSRIADPGDPGRVFSWLVSRSLDGRGNAIVYDYQTEDGAGVDAGLAHERHRSAADRCANRYLKRIRYGNRVSRLAEPGLADPAWLFEVVLDYGDHDPEAPDPAPDRVWPVRPDAFSSYRSGFEVRTYRLCRRVLMFHHFPEEPGVGVGCLVRSTSFGYEAGEAVGEFLVSVVQSGHRRSGDGYVTRSLPPLELGYSPATLRGDVSEVELAGDGAGDWVDLDGEGLPGLLVQPAAGWLFRSNLGQGRLGPARPVAPAPSLAGARTRLLDLAGDGRMDVVADRPVPGFFERGGHGAGWENFVALRSLPTVDWDDPRLRLVDLDGDGHADLLVPEDDAVVWYRSVGEAGFEPGRRVSLAAGEHRGPRLVWSDPAGSVHLADMSGDGLADLVRVRNGEVCYWPNLGHGRFGARVVMDDPPVFDRAELFDPARLRLADVDGSGVTDLIYLAAEGVRIHLNRSGNGWTPARLVGTGRIGDPTRVATIDLLGTGTTCLVWAADRPGGHRLRYVDLLGSVKPHLLTSVVNNLGAETLVEYAPSTRFYLADRAAGRPWLTRLPFPVQVVERVEVRDRISRNRFVSRYAYHHGDFDGVEREFGGFGMVEQWDTEQLATVGGEVDFQATNEDPASHLPPVLTRSWFHTGRSAGAGTGLSRQFAAEYWREPGLSPAEQEGLLLADTPLPERLRLPDGTAVPHQPTAGEVREAGRALRGRLLRQEVYAQDGSEAAGRPYLAAEHNYTVEFLQPAGPAGRPAVSVVHPRETVSYHYERALYQVGGVEVADPRVSQQATLDVDGYGNVLRAVSVGYGRRHPGVGVDPQLPGWAAGAVRSEQARLMATLTVADYTTPIDAGEHHRGPLPCRTRSYELVGLPAPAGPARYSYQQLRELADATGGGGHDLAPEAADGTGAVGPGPWRRLLEHRRTLYRRDDQAGPLPLGQAQPLGLPHESYQLALTPGLVAGTYQDLLPDPGAVLTSEGGYLADPEGWWVRSGQLSYDPGRFYLPTAARDPFGNLTMTSYDPYDLLVSRTQDAAGNQVTAAHDYRVLQPWLVTDPNGNRSAVAFDALGMVTATAVMGKSGQDQGDTLAGLAPDQPPELVTAHLADPLADPHALLGTATSRLVCDLSAYHRTRDEPDPRPVAVCTLLRETHHADLQPGEQTRIQQSFSYSDGFEREIQRKVQAEPGPAGGPRWVGSGWTVFNNKGKPVRQYQPFFADTHEFDFEKAEGVGSIHCYDPVERVVAVLAPDRSYAKTLSDPWQQVTWDGNDTVLLDPRTDPDVRGFLAGHLATQPDWQTWHAARAAGQRGDRERVAAARTEAHAGTPQTVYADPLGRSVVDVARNRTTLDGEVVEARHATMIVLDLAGNQRARHDELGRQVVRCRYDLAGNCLHQQDMDAGGRWTMFDVTGNPIYQWDSSGHRQRQTYDPLRRPSGTLLSGPGGPERLAVRRRYGESHPDAEDRNLRGQLFQVWDAAGVVTTDAYDFKGSLLRSQRQLTTDHRTEPDWLDDAPLAEPVYTSTTSYDALDRPATVRTPDGSVIRNHYNEANLPDRVEVSLRGATPPELFVADLTYDASGQCTGVGYGNGTRTEKEYDPSTSRLVRATTFRGGERLQDLQYTYDPVGNPAHVRDGAQPDLFFRNQRVAAEASYTYDAVYRLVEATGREHLGQAGTPTPHRGDDAPRVGLSHPGDGTAMAGYRQRFQYDQAGNPLAVVHRGTDPAHPGWTRRFDYLEPSGTEPGRTGNRLTSTRVGIIMDSYSYDPHGNLATMPHLPVMQWDHRDRLRLTARQVVAGGIPETTWYGYDAGGARVRKVTDRAAASGQTPARRAEHLYLGGFEIRREYAGDGVTVVRERETLHVLAGGQRIALVETRTRGQDPGPERLLRYQLPDHLGSSAVELDGAGQIISREEYYPFGSTSYQAVRSQTETPKRFRYTGKERDAETGMCDHGARYYLPWLLRWASGDRGGTQFADGLNGYAYVRNNPLRYADRNGREAVVTVDPKLRVATVSTTVHLYGGTDAEVRALTRVAAAAHQFWANPTVATDGDVATALAAGTPVPNAGLTASVGGHTWRLQFDITYQVHKGKAPVRLSSDKHTAYDIDTKQAAADGVKPGHSVITLQPPPKATPGKSVGGDLTTVSVGADQSNLTGTLKGDFRTAADREGLFRRLIHETGHAVGFDERYGAHASLFGGTYPGFDRYDVMTVDNGYSIRVINPLHVEEYLTFAAGLAATLTGPAAASPGTFLVSGHVDDTNSGALRPSAAGYPAAQATAVTDAVARATRNTAALARVRAAPTGTAADLVPNVPVRDLPVPVPAKKKP